MNGREQLGDNSPNDDDRAAGDGVDLTGEQYTMKRILRLYPCPGIDADEVTAALNGPAAASELRVSYVVPGTGRWSIRDASSVDDSETEAFGRLPAYLLRVGAIGNSGFQLANVAVGLADVAAQRGDSQQELRHLNRALATYDRLGVPQAAAVQTRIQALQGPGVQG